MTLYEVVLSLAILLGSITVLSNLIATGSRAALRSRLSTRATLLCQSKLSEILAGVEPMQSADGIPFDTADPSWTWTLEVLSGPVDDLLELRVSAVHTNPNQVVDAAETITRYIRDPQVYEEAATQENASSASDDSSTTGPAAGTGP